MKNIKILLKFQKIKKINFAFARGKNDWEPGSSHPTEFEDEHEAPKQEEIIREIFDRDYYKFGLNNAGENHGDPDMFNEYRQWQHLYVHPKEPVLDWKYGSIIAKYIYLCSPLMIFIFYFYIFPVMIYFNYLDE